MVSFAPRRGTKKFGLISTSTGTIIDFTFVVLAVKELSQLRDLERMSVVVVVVVVVAQLAGVALMTRLFVKLPLQVSCCGDDKDGEFRKYVL